MDDRWMSVDEIANYLGVSIRCFYEWQLAHKELAQSLKRGAEASDDRVEDSLYQSAIGGNVTAMIFYLKNRRPDRWRDVQNINADVGHYILSDRPMSEDQWIAERTKVIEHTPSPSLADTVTDAAKPLK